MKKILAFFLVVVVLLGSTQLTIYADNESQGQEITTSVTNGESTKNENDSSMITNEKTVNNESTSPEKTADVKNSSITGKVKLIINTQYFKKNIQESVHGIGMQTFGICQIRQSKKCTV